MREPDVTWDNIRPTTAVRLDRSPYAQGLERGREEGRAAVLRELADHVAGFPVTGPGGPPAHRFMVSLMDFIESGGHPENTDRGSTGATRGKPR